MIYSKDKLVNAFLSGKKLKYLFFWGHQKKRNGLITSSCLSQWYICKFKVNEISYSTAEHFMMAEKAKLFNDQDALKRVLNSKSPGEAKSIGREVLGFNQKVWEDNRIKIVVEGNYHKFKQNPELMNFLIGTKKRILVEASPVDAIWGIGLDKDNSFASVPVKWRGENLLGFALMQVRAKLILENEAN